VGALAARPAPEVALCTAIVALFLLYNAGYFLPLGGWTPGPRFLLPALPFATVLVALVPRVFRPLIAAQVAYSVILVTVATTTMPNAPEVNHSPLRDLWLPRLLSRDLAETTAWLRWGFHGLQPFFVIGLACGLAAIALVATTAATWAGRRVVLAATLALAALTLTFGSPIGPTFGGIRLAGGIAPGKVAIADAGVTHGLATTGGSVLRPWAQLTNGDKALAGTKVIFSIYGPTGERVWAAWHGDVAWQPGERKRLLVEWRPGGAAPGVYRLDVAVTSADEQVIYASMANAALITIQRPPGGTPRAAATTWHPTR
jgi:hypothetical protein